MNTGKLKRIEILEKHIGVGTIPDSDRFIVILYPNGNRAEFDRQYRERLFELKAKYGQNVSEDDFVVVGIRKFGRCENS